MSRNRSTSQAGRTGIRIWSLAAVFLLVGTAGGQSPETPVPASGAAMEMARTAAQEAAARLREGTANGSVVALQETVVKQLEELLAVSPRQVEGLDSSGTTSTTSTPMEPASEPDAASGGAPMGGTGEPSSGSRDASESQGGRLRAHPETGPMGDREQNFKSRLGDSVWGHLPERIREELYRSFSESYAPGYESMVSRYFERLAAPEASEDQTDGASLR